MKHKLIFCLGILLGLILAGPAAFADEENPFSVTLDSRFLAESEVNRLPDSVDISIYESTFGLGYEFKAFHELPVELGLTVKHIGIDSNTPTELPSRLEGRELKIGTKFPVPFVMSDEYFMGIDVFPSMYTDDWNWETSAFRAPFRAYVIYKPSDDFHLVGGVRVRIDYDDVAVPIIGFYYKASDELTFNLASDDPNIAYKLNDEATVFWEFGYALDEYEVTRGADEGVVLKYREASTGVGLKYNVAQTLEAQASVGGVFGRRLDYEDSKGKVEPDGTVYARAKLMYKF